MFFFNGNGRTDQNGPNVGFVGFFMSCFFYVSFFMSFFREKRVYKFYIFTLIQWAYQNVKLQGFNYN